MVKRAVILAALVSGCLPSFGEPASLVDGDRILAVRADPPEVRPGNAATFTALVVGTGGTQAMPDLSWALCTAPKPLDENNIVSGDCLGGGDSVMSVGDGPSVSALVPADARALFGPDPPPQVMGMPPLRPRDPDVTGGYYQPLRLAEGTLTGFALERITCDLALAGADLAVQYGMTYKANQNPQLTPLSATVDGAAVALDMLPAGKSIDFHVGWPAASVESFPVYDLTAAALVTQRESMRVSWFATGGAFAHEVTGTTATDTATTTDDAWTAPATAGVVHLWVVLRDSRGGVDFAGYDLVVR
jgi:hypothetical protein